MTATLALDTIRALKANGQTTAEAVSQFNRAELAAAMFDKLEDCATPEQLALLAVVCEADREAMNDRDMADAIELWLAGWTSDPGTPPQDVFSWYWRAPAKGKRPLGRKYLSTYRALTALRKGNQKKP